MTVQLEKPKPTPASRVSTQVRNSGQAGRKPGTGATTTVTVKGQPASTTQLQVINGALAEADQLGASQRVMIAIVMCMTQESGCLPLHSGDRDSLGPFQQRTPWGTETEREDPESSCRLFLLGGHSAGTYGWTHYYGSVKNAPGDLGAGVQKVQGSAYPTAYAQWQAEATKTVSAWLGGKVAGENSSFSVTSTRTVIEPYEFTRGQVGQRETSWACMKRLGDDVGWSRWAELNTLFYVSDEELRHAAPSLEITGDEDWLRNPIAYEWSPKRAVNKLTLDTWADRWGCQIGACVLVNTGKAWDGRYLVSETHGTMVNPELQVVLERPAPKRLEPAPQTREVTSSSTFAGGGQIAAGRLPDGKSVALGTPEAAYICAAILSNMKIPYVYGGGHAAGELASHHPPNLDCSGSVCWVLHYAGMWPSTSAATSGGLESWGAAGKGRQMTVYASASHTFIRFELDGQPDMQLNTSRSSYPDGTGPRLVAWGGPGASDASSGRFVARHFPGC